MDNWFWWLEDQMYPYKTTVTRNEMPANNEAKKNIEFRRFVVLIRRKTSV